MNKEQKIKMALWLAAAVLIALFFAKPQALSQQMFYYAAPLLFIINILAVLEVYLRIQHNIDKIGMEAKEIEQRLEKKIENVQDNISKEMGDFGRLYEETAGFLEVLIVYLEELKNKDGLK